MRHISRYEGILNPATLLKWTREASRGLNCSLQGNCFTPQEKRSAVGPAGRSCRQSVLTFSSVWLRFSKLKGLLRALPALPRAPYQFPMLLYLISECLPHLTIAYVHCASWETDKKFMGAWLSWYDSHVYWQPVWAYFHIFPPMPWSWVTSFAWGNAPFALVFSDSPMEFLVLFQAPTALHHLSPLRMFRMN